MLRELNNDEYGGLYFDKEQNLHIWVVDEKAIEEKISKINSNNDSANQLPIMTYEEATYSINELGKIISRLLSEDKTGTIQYAGIDESKNSLVIYTTDISNKNTMTISTVCEVENIHFIYCSKTEQTKTTNYNIMPNKLSATKSTVNVYGGMGIIYDGLATMTCSAVYPYSAGSNGWDVGFMSVAHEFQTGYNCWSRWYLNYLGQCTAHWDVNNGHPSCDIAFIDNNYNSHGWINDNSGNSTQITSRARPIAGATTYYMYGAKSAIRKPCQIIATNIQGLSGGCAGNIKMFSYSYEPQPGDSGGPIVRINSNGTATIVGYNTNAFTVGMTNSNEHGLGMDIKEVEYNCAMVPCT